MWDFRLVKGLELYDNMMEGNIPIYLDRSDRVNFEVGTFVSKSRAVLDRAEEKAREGKSKNYGKTFYAIPVTSDGGPLPTLEEFLEQEARKRSEKAGNIRIRDTSPFSNANWEPPES